jgi:hypothetical protein
MFGLRCTTAKLLMVCFWQAQVRRARTFDPSDPAVYAARKADEAAEEKEKERERRRRRPDKKGATPQKQKVQKPSREAGYQISMA